MSKYCEIFAQNVAESVKGTSLEGAATEVISYFEDDKYTIGVDLVGRPCDERSKARLFSYLRALGFADVECAEVDDILPEGGVRVYVSSEEPLRRVLNRQL